jgi:hypothetical protein
MTSLVLDDAGKLIAFGLKPRLRTAQDNEYRDLAEAYTTDTTFAATVRSIAMGMGLMVLECGMRTGLVLAAEEGSAFAMSIAEYSRRAGLEGRAQDRVLHGLAHLGAAVLAFPRPDTLADEGHVGRLSVDGVDAMVREACRLLTEKARDNDEDLDVPAHNPGLERAWRLYERRAGTPGTKDGRAHYASTSGMVKKALTQLAEQGFLTKESDDAGGTFTATARYQVHVRELSALRAFADMTELGLVVVTDGSGSLDVTSPSAAAAAVEDTMLATITASG